MRNYDLIYFCGRARGVGGGSLPEDTYLRSRSWDHDNTKLGLSREKIGDVG